MEKKKTKTEMARAEPAIDQMDELSSFPDEIISHILSFLPTKHAVATAVLRRRWKDQWASVSNLDFDDSLVYDHEPPKGKISFQTFPSQRVIELPASCTREFLFCRFVYNVLTKHTNLNSVRRFRFHCPAGNRFLKLLEMKLSKRELNFGTLVVEEIDVTIRGKSKLGIPESFYTLENLKVARLSGFELDSIQGPVFLPRLKILEISVVEMKDVGAIGRLVSGCPVLENAHLEKCYPCSRNGEHLIEVSSSSLKWLKIIRAAVVIEAPNLEDLYLGKNAEWEFKGSSPFPCLHSADVDLHENPRSYLDLIGLLTAISNARKIRLSGPFLSRLSGRNDHVQFPVFPKFDTFDDRKWRAQLGSALLAQLSPHTTISCN